MIDRWTFKIVRELLAILRTWIQFLDFCTGLLSKILVEGVHCHRFAENRQLH